MTIKVTTSINKSMKKAYAIAKDNGIVSIYVFNNYRDRMIFTEDTTGCKSISNKSEHLNIAYSLMNDDSVDIANIPFQLLAYTLNTIAKDNTVVLYKCKHHYINKLTMKFVDKVFNKNCSSTYEY
jgi:hypothetical protein